MNRYEAAACSIRDELVRALRAARADFKALPKTARGCLISGMSLDFHVQHGYVAVSLCGHEDTRDYENIGDWQYAQFLSSLDSGPQAAISRMARIMNRLYAEIPEGDLYGRMDRQHMLHLVAAEALLDEKVTKVLIEYGIEVPVFGDELGSAPFEFFVYDPDGGLRANYCDIVRAHRVTSRILQHEVSSRGSERP